MHSKTSRARPPQSCPWKEERSCSEEALAGLAQELAGQLAPGNRVALEGPMGSGKSAFARRLLSALGAGRTPEGSPSFAIAHEYVLKTGREAIHIDFYRLAAESEIEDAGIPSYFWERDAIVVTEWLSLWPSFERAVFAESTGAVWEVRLAFVADAPEVRAVTIFRRLAGEPRQAAGEPSPGAKGRSRAKRSR